MTEQATGLIETALGLEKQFEFQKARDVYRNVQTHFPGSPESLTAGERLEDMDDLIEELETYKRIDENGRRVLTEIGINIAEAGELLDILMEADAVDYENDRAVFVPLKADYIDRCLDLTPRHLPLDPGVNAFGTGATPPFLHRPGDDRLLGASREEFAEIARVVGRYTDVVKIFSLPVAFERAMPGVEAARVMEVNFPGLKMTATHKMDDSEAAFLKGKPDWVDGTSLIVNLGPMKNMIAPFLRSARVGNNLLLLDLTIAGQSGAGSPEALLTQIHAQVLFMTVLAQTVNPGVICVHGGIPGVTEAGGDLSYSSPHQPLINAAMARVNRWVTGLPSAQSGGSTSLNQVTPESLAESEQSRNTMRRYGCHIVRHAMGAIASLNFFSLEKFVQDCELERRDAGLWAGQEEKQGVCPMYFPRDDRAMEGLREMAEKGNPRYADHTLRNVESFDKWEKTIRKAARNEAPRNKLRGINPAS